MKTRKTRKMDSSLLSRRVVLGDAAKYTRRAGVVARDARIQARGSMVVGE